MAKQVYTVLESDLSGQEAQETVSFGLDGRSYTIDLTDKEAAELRQFLARYVDNGELSKRPSKGAKRASSAGGDSAEAQERKAARAWLIGEGILSEGARGRISAANMEAYRASLATPKRSKRASDAA